MVELLGKLVEGIVGVLWVCAIVIVSLLQIAVFVWLVSLFL